MKNRSLPILLTLLSCLCHSAVTSGQSLLAENLPEFSSARTLNGELSSASFRGGVSGDAGHSLSEFFTPEDYLSIFVEIEIEPQHLGRSGSLYVVVDVDGEFFMRSVDGSYQAWNESLGALQATVADRPLQATEALTLLQDVQFAPLGLIDITLSIYLAYSLSDSPNQLYYSATPLSLSVSDTHSAYNPTIPTGIAIEQLDTVVFDNTRNREIPVLIYLPEQTTPSPVLLFSHGLGGSRFGAGFLGEHWADRGYTVAFLQHPGSDESILENVALSDILAVMNAAASAENSIARIADVSTVLDQLEIWNLDSGHVLYSRLNMELVGMSGHSFGAKTTQAVSGQDVLTVPGANREPRIKASVVLSPSISEFGDNADAFSTATIPWLLMTGTKDVSLIGNTSVEDRLAVYPLLPAGNKYELVLHEGEHHAFTDRPVSATQIPRNPAHHGEIAAISTAFWDAWLSGKEAARRWLEGEQIQSVLQPGDSWQFK